jgi:tetratricopeptide (TPR) repeat protein
MFRIFLSSTFRDLKVARAKIKQSLTDSLVIVGMEEFIPSEKTPHETSIRELNKCQIYILLMGYRYGSIISQCRVKEKKLICCRKDRKACNKISYTQCEYENAIGRDMPRMAIALEGVYLEFLEFKIAGEKKREERERLERFKKKVEKTETCKTLDIQTEEDLDILGEKIKEYLGENMWNWIFDRKLSIPDFYGRMIDLKDLKEKFAQYSIICINGVGGIGKTSLVQVFLLLTHLKIETIYMLMKESQRYKNTEAGYKLAKEKFKWNSYREKLDLGDIACLVLNLREKDYNELQKKAGNDGVNRLIIDKLEQEKAILVLDDFQDARNDANDFVRSCLNDLTSAKVLIISRDIPKITCEANIEIKGISKNDFYAYISKLAQDFDKDIKGIEKEIATQIEVVTQRHPLLTRLIVANWDILGIDGLKNLGSIIKSVRNQNEVEELFARLIKEVLTDEEYKLLKYLSIHRIPFTVESVDMILLCERDHSNEIINSLITKKMLMKDKKGKIISFSYDSIKDISQFKLEEEGNLQHAHEMAAIYYTTLLGKKLEKKKKETAEYLYHLAKSGKYSVAYTEVLKYVNFLIRWGYWNEVIDIYDALLEYYGKRKGKISASLYLYKSTIYIRQGKYEEAVKSLDESLKIGQNLVDERGIASSFHGIAEIYKRQSKYGEALRLYNESLKILEKLGDKKGVAWTLGQIAHIHSLSGDYDVALREYEKSHKIRTELVDMEGVAYTIEKIAEIREKFGELEKALKLYEESLRIRKEMGKTRKVAISLDHIARVYQRLGNYDTALEKSNESLDILKTLEDPPGIAHALNQIGQIHVDKGEYEKALKLHNESLKIYKTLGNQDGIAYTIGEIAHVQSLRGEYDDALKKYEKKLKIVKDLDNQKGVAYTLSQIGAIYEVREEYGKALRLYEESFKINEKIGNQNGVSRSLYNMAYIHYFQGAYDEALSLYNKRLGILKDLKDPHGIAKTHEQIAMIMQDRGEYNAALRLLQESFEILDRADDKREIAFNLIQTSLLFIEKGELKSAYNYVERAHEIFVKLGNPVNVKKSKEVLEVIDKCMKIDITVKKFSELKKWILKNIRYREFISPFHWSGS